MHSHVVPLLIHGENVLISTPTNRTLFKDNSHLDKSKSIRWEAQGTTKELCTKAVNSCAEAFQSWSLTPLGVRGALFKKLSQYLLSEGNTLASLIQEEFGCSEIWTQINVQDTIAIAQYIATLANSDTLSSSVPETRENDSHTIIFERPLGVVLGIAPWNAPAILGLRAVAAPVMAGNCAVLKGSELSPRTHYFIADAFRQVGFPPGVVNFLVHRPEDASEMFETLISHPDVRKCNFTGSTAVGRHIAMRAAFYLTPVLLELGGKNYCIILDDADLEAASNMVLEGALLNSGQICMSTDMVLVSNRVKSDFSKLLRDKLQDFSEQHVRKLISAKSEARILSLRNDAEAKGASLITATAKDDLLPERTRNGGNQYDQVYATVIEDVTPEMDFWAVESFGPLIGIASCESLEDAIAIVNAGSYGLSAAIWTRQSHDILKHTPKINVGAIHINGSTVHDEPTLPHGGCKNSGWGRFGGHWALREFVQTQTVITK